MSVRVVMAYDMRPDAVRARNEMNRMYQRPRPWVYVVRDAWREGRWMYELLRVAAGGR